MKIEVKMSNRTSTAWDAGLGLNIRTFRKAIGMTQGELAAHIGVTFQQVQKYESGANRITAAKLADIARALGRDFLGFFDESPKTSALNSILENPRALLAAKTVHAVSEDIQKLMLTSLRCVAVAAETPSQ
jgi:transcriptional regulator with XRE-family HTH domain